MKAGAICLWAVGCCALSAGAIAQSRDTGWEFGGDVIYQTSQDVDFEGGSTASFEDDIGLSLTVGYRLNDRLEFHFGIDWSTVDYQATLVNDMIPGLTATVDGDLEAITPFARAHFNFIDGPLTPYVSAGIGWSFIDTNIPNGPPQTGCWWDPWWGYVCDTYQSTRSTDAFTYDIGLGLRWDTSSGYSFRLAYEKHWYDLENAGSAPDFDRFKVGIVFVY